MIHGRLRFMITLKVYHKSRKMSSNTLNLSTFIDNNNIL